MKIFGYEAGGGDGAEIRPAALDEITLQASPAELRKIAAFLNACADGIETRGKDWEHEHLSDRVKEFEGSPHFVVFNPEAV
ncbi:hypothetical protein [Herbaspirillum sp. ST 5-3]|uniref:Imm32 family immunity protein n=1 Tax=Oxalobacteraceae TaxID=75682 RepID=UPI0010A3041B|nr:hypothetical protein [Herbaspirillum sp. ST 5-3]